MASWQLSESCATAVNPRKELEEQMTSCPVCFERFETPKVLPCQHTFCLKCLKKMAAHVTAIICPTCRRACTLPVDGADGLPGDFKIGQIQDLLHTFERDGPPEIVCPVCRNRDGTERVAESFCVQCTTHYCTNCAAVHSQTRLFTGHTVVDTAQREDSRMCSEHRSSAARYYCNGCARVVCTVCVQASHDGHAVVELQTAASNMRRHLCSLVIDIPTSFAMYRSKVDAIEALKREHHRTHRESVDGVRKAAAECVARVCEAESLALERLKASKEAKVALLDGEIKCSIEKVRNIKSLQDYVRDVLQPGNIGQLLDTFDEMSRTISALMSEHPGGVAAVLREAVCFCPGTAVQVSLGELKSSVLVIPTSLSGAEQQMQTESDMHNGRPEEIRLASKEPVRPKTSNECGRPPNARSAFLAGLQLRTRSSSVEARQSNVPAAPPMPTLVTTSTPALTSLPRLTSRDAGWYRPSLVATNSAPPPSENATDGASARRARRSVLSESSSRLPTEYHGSRRDLESTVEGGRLLWMAEDLTRCRDCCFIGDGQLVTCDSSNGRGQLRVFSAADGYQVQTIQRTCIDEPWGLHYNAASSLVIVTDHGNNTVMYVQIRSNASGSSTSSLASVSVSSYICRYILDRPSGIAVTRTGNYVITNAGDRSYGSGRIGIYAATHSQLNKIRDFGKPGAGDGEVLKASYVAVDHEDRIFVADSDAGRVKVFNTTGQPLFAFSSVFDDFCPHGLAVDESNNILVADRTSRLVTLHSPDDGAVIQEVIQCRGSPWGIAFDAEQKLLAVATDRGLEMYTLRNVL